MSNHTPPIVPHVLYVAEQHKTWRLAPIERLITKYHTPTTVATAFGTADSRVKPVKGKSGVTLQQHYVWCLPDDAAWQRVQAARAQLQQALDEFAGELRRLGAYARRLEEAGGIKKAPARLSATVIAADDPDSTGTHYFVLDPVPRIHRADLDSHTPMMLRITKDGRPWSTTHQRDHFVCPDDTAWELIQQRQAAAQAAYDDWKKLLSELGTYQQALADKRYAQLASAPAITAPAPEPPVPNWPRIAPPLSYGHHRNASDGGFTHVWRPAPTPRSKDRHETLCGTVMTELPRRVPSRQPGQSGPPLCAKCREKAADLLRAQEVPPVTPTPTPAPARPRLVTTTDPARTDATQALLVQLQVAGYTWQLAKQTPDGRWHHVVSARNQALLRNDQVMMRRERLEALLAPKAPELPAAPQPLTLSQAIAALRSAGYSVRPHGVRYLVAAPGAETIIHTDVDLIEKATIVEQIAGRRATATAPELPAVVEPTPVLTTRLQELARQYLGAMRRSGEALLEASSYITEAHQRAAHGEWKVWLEATGTSEAGAEQLLNIYARAASDDAFADAIKRNFLSRSTAALLARPSTPPEVVEQALQGSAPPTVTQVRQEIAASRPAKPDTYQVLGSPVAPKRPNAPEGWVWRDSGAMRRLVDGLLVGPNKEFATTVAAAEAADQVRRNDAEHIAAVRELIIRAADADSSTQTLLHQEAYGHARQVREAGAYRAMMAEVDRAVEAAGAVHKLNPIPAPQTCGTPPPRTLGPGQPEPAPWPEAPEGWRWNRRGAPAHLIAPDGWRTADYNYPERAIAEAQRRILSMPKPAEMAPLVIGEGRGPVVVPTRPRRPISADVSAQLAYTQQLEFYATKLEQRIAELEQQVTTPRAAAPAPVVEVGPNGRATLPDIPDDSPLAEIYQAVLNISAWAGLHQDAPAEEVRINLKELRALSDAMDAIDGDVDDDHYFQLNHAIGDLSQLLLERVNYQAVAV